MTEIVATSYASKVQLCMINGMPERVYFGDCDDVVHVRYSNIDLEFVIKDIPDLALFDLKRQHTMPRRSYLRELYSVLLYVSLEAYVVASAHLVERESSITTRWEYRDLFEKRIQQTFRNLVRSISDFEVVCDVSNNSSDDILHNNVIVSVHFKALSGISAMPAIHLSRF